MTLPPNAMNPRMAMDARSLDRLRVESRTQSDEALRAAAKQFEAVFMNTLMKSMRDALPQTDLLASSQSKMLTGMFDQELAGRMSDRGIGLADVLVRQIEGAQRSRVGPLRRDAESSALQKLDAAAAAGRSGATGPQAFVRDRMGDARVAQQATGVPAEFVLGQAALESGWGQREIRHPDGRNSFNLFGIKAGANWSGGTVDVTTTEYVGGVAKKQVERFRSYGSYAEAFQDYARLISTSPRYANAVKGAQSAEGFAQGLQQGGYATDPRYADKLTRVINHTIAIARGGPRTV